MEGNEVEEKTKTLFLEQIKHVLTTYTKLRPRILSDDEKDCQKIITLVRATIERISGTSSPYYKQTKEILNSKDREWQKAMGLIGVLESLEFDLKANYLQTFEEMIHGEIFSDFIEMAGYLLEKKFKDSAAVIAGSSLEAHLRQLCVKNGISIDTMDKKGKTKRKKSNTLNDELAKIYGKTEQKAVAFWLDIRNNAAHGHYEKYTLEQVQNMHIGILQFMIRHPA